MKVTRILIDIIGIVLWRQGSCEAPLGGHGAGVQGGPCTPSICPSTHRWGIGLAIGCDVMRCDVIPNSYQNDLRNTCGSSFFKLSIA